MLEPVDRAAIMELIYRLRDTPPQKPRQAEIKQRQLRWRLNTAEASSELKQPIASETYLRDHGSDPFALVAVLMRQIDRWFELGEPCPSHAAERLLLLLQSYGATKIERAFLAVYMLHFAFQFPERAPIMIRARELSAYPVLEHKRPHIGLISHRAVG